MNSIGGFYNRHRKRGAFLFTIILYGKDEDLKNNLSVEQSFSELAADRVADPETATPPDQPVYMLKQIGSTTYKVAVHFSQNTKETASEKIALLIRNERLVKQ